MKVRWPQDASKFTSKDYLHPIALHGTYASLICSWHVDKGSANGYSRCDSLNWQVCASSSSKRNHLHLGMKYCETNDGCWVMPLT